MRGKKWHKLQPTCLICGEVGPYYLVTKEKSLEICPGMKIWEHNIEWFDKHQHNGKNSISTKFID